MDERIETFLRDLQSDVGKNPNAVAENTRQRIAAYVKTARALGSGLEQADQREKLARLDLEKRVNDEIQRYRGTATEQHLLIVLRTLRKERQQKEGAGFVDRG